MDIAGVRRTAARVAGRLRRSPRASGMRELAEGLHAALRVRTRPPVGARELCRALCEEMSARRGGRPVQLRFERFPDEIEVTGLWVGFQDFDLVIVEERAEGAQQLVILGHELWHLHVGHSHHHTAGTALAGEREWSGAALSVAARDGSRAAEEAEADAFGRRLAATLRPLLPGGDPRRRPPGPGERDRAAVPRAARPPLWTLSPRTPAGAGPSPRRGRPAGSPPPGGVT
ncbi:toxin-antitoxin system, toxin component family protein [Streptomyces panaciradicis]|uniref:toxin-antitoxin system, toxin component family protein n=1 Tax=Streptomyces panaciradicis TaxID=1470261 RepID=UPI00201D2546|nr:toxin-antitoxin system, toxin component family protein [Streptomyces panaciradicis]MCL6671785.1 toxin-antitoxin system, toxin component family protein [Streptomyces panaciradicis]